MKNRDSQKENNASCLKTQTKITTEDNILSTARSDHMHVGEDDHSASNDKADIVGSDYSFSAKHRDQRVKFSGRRRLCKGMVDGDGEEDERFLDAELDSSVSVSDFISHSHARIIGNKFNIVDILSNLNTRFGIFSNEIRKRLSEHLSSSSHSVLDENFTKHKSVKISEHVSNQSYSSPKATATNKEYIVDVCKKNQVGKAVSAKSFLHSQKSKNVKDDDDCIVTSGQKFVQKVEGGYGNLNQESDNSSKVYTPNDGSSSGDEVPFFPYNPRFSLPVKIANKLYPHQLEGLKWLWSLHCQGKGGILGDDMGLGKTMQICAFLAGLFHSNLIKRVLVVAPRTLLPHWMKELGMVNLSGKTRIYSGTCATTRQSELRYILQDKGVLLTSYDIARNNVKSLSGDYDEMDEEDVVTWDYMILDEGHLIKNPRTKRAKSLRNIPCAHRIIISGTPLQNNLKELWALFNFCCPDLLGDIEHFRDKYEGLILCGSSKNASTMYKLIGSVVAQDLRKQIQPYFLRRLKRDVFCGEGATNTAKSFRKEEIVVWLRLSSCQRQLYEAFLKSELNDYSPLAALTIMKKICDHPLLLTKTAAKSALEGMKSMLNQEDHWVAEKLAMHIADVSVKYDIGENYDILSCKISFIMSLLDNLIPEGHNVLIFSQTRQMLNLIQSTLNARGYRFLRIDGTTKVSDRIKIVNNFQEGNGAPIFLLTSKVGGLGLTLTKADRVIVVDPAWNPSTDNQSVDRSCRIGQNKNVLVYRLITCSTVEEKIYQKQIYKSGLFKSATENQDQTRYFSRQDLKDLFSLPNQGFGVSLTQQQLHKEHDCQHKMDPSLEAHTKFLESLGIAGISHHSLLYSKTTPVPVFNEELTRIIRQSTYMSRYWNSSSWPSLHQHNLARFGFNKRNNTRRKKLSLNIFNKLKQSEIKQVNCPSQYYANKAVVTRLQEHVGKLSSELQKLRRLLLK